MSARYLIRMDDACEVMDAQKWGLVERVLDEHAVKPIVAVVPDNRDPELAFDRKDPAFWDKVRGWQAKGWTIGMHGHTHVMHPTRAKLLVPFYARTEFAGLPLEEQAVKIRASWQLFNEQGVRPRVWVGPAHSFDALTLEAVRAETPIRVVSDGIAWNAYYEYDFHWVPQQMWALAERRSGLWTVCLHPNTMTEASIRSFANALQRFRGRMSSFDDVRLSAARKSLRDRLYHHYFWWRWRNRPQAAA